jgi:hypothetical protein
MIKRLIFLIAYMAICQIAVADNRPEYAADKIKSGLVVNANAVMRSYERSVTIADGNNVVIKTHYVCTILNKHGDEYAFCRERFSKLELIDEIYGFIYDKDGIQKREITKDFFQTFSTTANAGYYGDSKVMICNATYPSYPYTVEFYIVKRQRYTFAFPDFVVRPAADVAVDSTSYKVVVSKSHDIRHRSVNSVVKPVISERNNGRVYTWTFTDIPAERPEPLAADCYSGSPVVLIAPVNFSFGSHEGNMSDWKSMGLFVYDLNRDRDILSRDKVAKVKELTAHTTDPYEKIRVLYKYMQDHTRYVSVQYGVGGWQTLEASFVSDNQYGDCKALSNYMLAMLKEVGISSYPVAVYAGNENYLPMSGDFPLNQFNHEILCVPVGNDTVWLECTSKDLPAGYLGSFTNDRDALMMTPDGGAIVHTPRYSADKNIISRNVKTRCNEDGSMTLHMNNAYSGIPADKLVSWEYMSEQEKDQYLHSKFNLPSYSATDYKLSRKDGRGFLAMEETVSISATNMIKKVGAYSVLNLDLAPLDIRLDVQVTERKKDFRLPVSYQVRDTFEITMPANTTVDALPKSVNLETPFGKYTLVIKQEQDKLLAVRNILFNDGVFKPAQYTDYEAWVDNINNPNNYQVILQNK